MTTRPGEPLVEIEHLKVYFPIKSGIVLDRHVGDIRAVDDVSLKISRGETVGLVGESGCGKSTVGRTILRLYKPTAGRILFEGRDISQLGENELRPLRRRMQMVFQDPFASLNPRMRISAIIAEPLVTNETVTSAQVRQRVLELLDLVGLSRRSADLFPHEFSGGQRQRIAIARALSLSPKLVVLDEPVSALDVSIRAQILNLLSDLQERLGLAYFFIAHDLAAVAHMSHTIAVIYLGRIVEYGDAHQVTNDPRHPYTQALFSASLPAHPDERREDIVLTGEVPSPLRPPSGCRFHPRCPSAMALCAREEPMLADVAGRQVACHLY
jgi:oligopeptide transport system ATP-binding protein